MVSKADKVDIYKGRKGLISAGRNPKTVKGDKGGEYATAIMYLAPASQSGLGNVCPMAVQAGCEKACLFKAGMGGVFTNIPASRIARTQRYFQDRAAFLRDLVCDIEGFVRWCAKRGVKPAVRLNGTSDIQWEVGHPVELTRRTEHGMSYVVHHNSIFEAFPEVQFYDYTKVYKRAYRTLPSNYRLTLSYSAANEAYSQAVVKAARETGANLAVVYRTKATRDWMMEQPIRTVVAEGWGGEYVQRPVIDGDSDDMRFLDATGVIVGLYAKGPAKKDATGFVVG
jgi:hypothetical protein